MKVSLHLHPGGCTRAYLLNVRNAVFRNVNGFLEHIEDLSREGTDRGKEEDTEAERFLFAVIDYCTSLLNDPSKRKKTCPGKGQTGERVRTRHASAGAESKRSGTGSKMAAAERPGG